MVTMFSSVAGLERISPWAGNCSAASAPDSLNETLEKILKNYLKHRQPRETFRQFTGRHDLNALQTIFSNAA